jgi:uncharacterized protein YjbI with pentapeptide repeats/transposase-like protein
MDRPRYSQDQITDLLREAELRLAQGKPLASVCKSLGISRSSYRQWRRKYGERATENAAPVASGNTGQTAGTHPASSEKDLLAREEKASPNGKVLRLSEEAEKLLDAANDASGSARNSWLAFIALLAYLLITLGGVSHKDLLLNSPVKLPIINVDIPLFSFFLYALLLLLLVYLALLIQHVVLAGKFRKFTDAIEPYEKKAGPEHPARELVHSYVVAQVLAGPKRHLVIRGLMRLMVFVTFTLVPVVTLLYFQLTFLPYHAVGITYWHRVAVLIGLAMLFVVLPMMQLRHRRRAVRVIGVAFAILVLGFSWVIATIPDEGVERWLFGFVPPDGAYNFSRAMPLSASYSPADVLNPLVRAAYQSLASENQGLLRWLLSYRVLCVEDADLVPDEGDKYGEVSVVLRERDLRFARLDRSDLHRADLTNANLRNALMTGVRLEKAKLVHTKLQGADLAKAELQGADLASAELQGANLILTQLQGTDCSEAKLQGAMLLAANLQGATLARAQLQGANLTQADLHGADLHDAQLQGADLSANLQGAWLELANLQGADLGSAQLQGVWLANAQLQGASLRRAKLQGAVLYGMHVWLAEAPGDLADLSPTPVFLGSLSMSPLSTTAKLAIRRRLQEDINDRALLKRVTSRLDPILRDDPPTWKDGAAWSRYISHAKEPTSQQLVGFWADMACGDRYLTPLMVKRASRGGFYAKPLAKALLDERCEGAKALTDETRTRLREIVEETE